MTYHRSITHFLVTAMLFLCIRCTGSDGKDGLDGLTGAPGMDGRDGRDGINGTNGTNGAAGTDGHEILVVVTDVEANPDAVDGVDGCNFGGKLIETGLDDGEGTANNGVLEASEVDESVYLCNGRDGSAMKATSGTIEPGNYLSLDLTDAPANLSYYAQVVVNGQVIDHADYSQYFSPLISQITVTDSVRVYDDLLTTELKDGNFALVFCGLSSDFEPGNIANDDYQVYFTVIDSEGATIVAPKTLTGALACGSFGLNERTPFITLSNGDVLMALYTQAIPESTDPDTGVVTPAVPSKVSLSRYDSNGDFVSSTFFDAPASTLESNEPYLGLTALGDGFALLHETATEIPAADPAAQTTYTYALQLDMYGAENSIVASQTWLNIGLGSNPAMSLNADGNINILLEVIDAENTDEWNYPNSETRAMVVTPTGDVVANVFLSNTYSYLNSISQATNGNWLVNFEYGGPDSTAYAVLNSAGEFVSAPQTYTDHEPTEIASLVFPDDSFGAIYFDDESLVGNIQCMTNEGQRFAPYTQFSGPIGPGYDQHFTKAVSNHEFMMIFIPYEEQSGIQMLRSARGHLEIRVESPTEVRLYNWAASSVNAVLSAN